MNIGKRLKALRAARNLSQRDIQMRAGLMHSYVSRVENGYATPGLKTLQRWMLPGLSEDLVSTRLTLPIEGVT
jgi:transcriptional regulator with XRE-family HTH domain